MKELKVEAIMQNLEAVTSFVNAELKLLRCPIKLQMQFDIAIDELFGNIVQYAYPTETGYVTVRIESESNPNAIAITFIDNGIRFAPVAREDPNIHLSVKERKIGGLGIYIVKKVWMKLSISINPDRTF